MKTHLFLGHYLSILVLFAPSFLSATPIDDMLVAEFTATATDGCAGIDIQFFNQSTGPFNQISWTFPGGIPTISTEANPSINFPDSGVYQVYLEITDGIDTAIDSVTIRIKNARPDISFNFQNNGLEVTFTNHSSGTTNYLWEFGDGNFSSEFSPQHSYAEEGVYIIRLRGTNDCKAVIKSEIVVLDLVVEPVTYTANDIAHPYTGTFRPGVNLGYFPPWTDATLADIAAGNPEKGVKGAGVKTIRPALFEYFLEEYDYDIRASTFKHYDSLGLKDNTVIIGFPSDEHRDTTHYCPEERSELFANMYEDIWDNGENGTPINDDNYYALYLWKMVNLYKDEVGFWEIWNEPGFDYTFVTGYLPPGVDNNWWDNNPDPCDYKLRAPIFHYVRLLRISYEVIKTIDPDSYVTLASVGFSAFLDAILRNTDNPNDGSVNSDYPLGGGAYFDAIGIHSYPHFDGTLRKWNNTIMDFDYFRHTDKAITSISNARDTFGVILDNYGYDGNTFPEKEWIITEINVPRKAFTADSYGSEEVQINFILKAYIESVRNELRQMQVYDMSESHTLETAISEFQLMGLYKVLFGIFPYGQEINKIGIAYRSLSELIFGAAYDPIRTAELQLPSTTDGAAFLDQNGHYHYILWAKTQEDLSEDVSATYSFPNSWGISTLQKRTWEHSENGEVSLLGAQDIALIGEPIFLKDTINTVLIAPTANFDFDINDFCIPTTVQFFDQSSTNATSWNWSFPGGTPAISAEQNPVITYDQAGTYSAQLEASNAAGNSIKSKEDLFDISELSPTAVFSHEIFDKMVSFNNQSENATHYRWDLGDNNVSIEVNPDHNYPVPGIYNVVLMSMNGCDTAYAYETVIINPEQINPIPAFSVDRQAGCPGLTVQYTNQSTVNADSYFWLFLGGTPSSSTEENPVVTYNTVGQHAVSLQAMNAAGSLAIFKDSFILIEEAPVADFQLTQTFASINTTNLSSGAFAYRWDFGDGTTSALQNPTHTYTQGGTFTIELKAINNCDTVSATQQVTIEAIPLAGFTADLQAGCPPFQVQFADTSSGLINQRQWLFPGGVPDNSIEANPLITYATIGQWEVQLIVFNATGSDTLLQDQYLIVLPSPTANFTYTGNSATYSFINTSQEIDSTMIQWNFGDGNSSTEVSPEHSYAGSGSYDVQLIVENTCGMDTILQTVEVLIDGVNELNFPAEVQLFPNPNKGQFVLLIQGEATEEIQLRIFNILGQKMHAETIDFRSGLLSKNYRFSNWGEGAYWIELRNEQYLYQRKFLLQSF